MISAEKARNLSELGRIQALESVYIVIGSMIESACGSGGKGTTLSVKSELIPSISSRMRDLGYEVIVAREEGGHREMTIRW